MDDESRYRWYELLLLAMVAGMLLISVLAVAQVCATPGPRFYETPATSPATLPDTTLQILYGGPAVREAPLNN